MTRTQTCTLANAALFAMLVSGCGGGDGSADTTGGAASGRSGSVDLTGAGATFPNPLYQKWAADYASATGIRINYQSVGSGGGIRQLSESTVDFGASDGPMTDEELATAKGGEVLHIPMVLGAVVIAYNLPEVTTPINLTGEVIADIYLGKITKWNDARLAQLNPAVTFPAGDILAVYRSDGSGTTYIFTDYLSAVSKSWAGGSGRGKQVAWPVGIGAKGNEGVAGQVKQTPRALGYMELAYAKQNKLPVARVRNAEGNFVEPTVESISAAAAGVVDSLPPNTDYRVSIVNAPGANAYPISSFTWILLYRQQADSVKARKLVDFLGWALREGGASAQALDYAPLPPALVSRLEERLGTVHPGAGR